MKIEIIKYNTTRRNIRRKLFILSFLLLITILEIHSTDFLINSTSQKFVCGNPEVTYFRQGCNTTFTLSWDDIRGSDFNLALIDEKYGITHTLFAPLDRICLNYSAWSYSFILDELFQGYDIQSHSGKHVYLSRYSSEEQEIFIKEGRDGLKELFGFTSIVFAYPLGDTGGSEFVKKYFDLGRTISNEGTSWPPKKRHLAGVTIPINGIGDTNIDRVIAIMKEIYRKPGYQIFKGYGHTNVPGTTYGVIDFQKYEEIISQIANWNNVWYTSWGEFVAYEIEKDHIKISEVSCFEDRIEFDISAPTLNTDIYKVPITLSLLIPVDWNNPILQIDGKFSSKYSIKRFNDCNEIFVDAIPQNDVQRIIIWKNVPFIDNTPPNIQNLCVTTLRGYQDFKPVYYTYMRFEVFDSLSDIFHVNATVVLKDCRTFSFPKIKNPIFWRNSTYGRIIWDNTIFNKDIPQITEEDIKFIKIDVQDSFGNTRRVTYYSKRNYYENIILGESQLFRLPDKEPSAYNRLPENLSIT